MIWGIRFPSQRGGSEANTRIGGTGASGRVLLIGAIIKCNYFCFRLYFKALIWWCFEIPWLKVIYKGKAVLCNKHIMPRWCCLRVCLIYSSEEIVPSIFHVSFSSCSTCWKSRGFFPHMSQPLKPSFAVTYICLKSASIRSVPRIRNFLKDNMTNTG